MSWLKLSSLGRVPQYHHGRSRGQEKNLVLCQVWKSLRWGLQETMLRPLLRTRGYQPKEFCYALFGFSSISFFLRQHSTCLPNCLCLRASSFSAWCIRGLGSCCTFPFLKQSLFMSIWLRKKELNIYLHETTSTVYLSTHPIVQP